MLALALKDFVLVRREKIAWLICLVSLAAFGYLALVLGFGMAAHAAYFSAYFIFGYENSRWAMLIFFGLVGALGGAMGGFGQRGARPGAVPIPEGLVGDLVAGRAPAAAYAAIVAAGAALYALSYLAALAKYRGREFR